MNALRLFTDEDVYAAIAPALREAGVDAISTPEADRLGFSDDSQLTWATDNGRVLMSFNVAHFAELHTARLRRGEHHAGIVVSSQRPIGDTLRRLFHLSKSLDANAMTDRLEYLGDW
ncbi:MAG: DUF5615 family PIN-like protein [Patescibacteria group bacterium]|nr:DUF5615 family PIN-like protein [Patescibacteria group bacterium]